MGAFLSREDEEDVVKLDSEKDVEIDLVEEPIVKSVKRTKTRSRRKTVGKTKRYRY
jgi:hypothetical protein